MSPYPTAPRQSPKPALAMHVNAAALGLLAAAASCPLVLAVPSEPPPAASSSLRLVKTSPKDPGQWVEANELWDRFISKDIGFVDITGIKVGTPHYLSSPGSRAR